MTQKMILAVGVLFFMSTGARAQLYERPFNGVLTGRVLDADLMQPVEYANIVLFSLQEGIQVTGTITDRPGSSRSTAGTAVHRSQRRVCGKVIS